VGFSNPQTHLGSDSDSSRRRRASVSPPWCGSGGAVGWVGWGGVESGGVAVWVTGFSSVSPAPGSKLPPQHSPFPPPNQPAQRPPQNPTHLERRSGRPLEPQALQSRHTGLPRPCPGQAPISPRQARGRVGGRRRRVPQLVDQLGEGLHGEGGLAAVGGDQGFGLLWLWVRGFGGGGVWGAGG